MNTTVPQQDRFIRLKDAKEYLSEQGLNFEAQTIRLWIKHGCNGCRLKGEQRGRLWFTKQSWLDQFFDRLNGEESSPEQIPTSPAAKRKKANRKKRGEK